MQIALRIHCVGVYKGTVIAGRVAEDVGEHLVIKGESTRKFTKLKIIEIIVKRRCHRSLMDSEEVKTEETHTHYMHIYIHTNIHIKILERTKKQI